MTIFLLFECQKMKKNKSLQSQKDQNLQQSSRQSQFKKMRMDSPILLKMILFDPLHLLLHQFQNPSQPNLLLTQQPPSLLQSLKE